MTNCHLFRISFLSYICHNKTEQRSLTYNYNAMKNYKFSGKKEIFPKEEGVFKSPLTGKWVARVFYNDKYISLFQHEDKTEVECIYYDYKNGFITPTW